MEVPKELPLPKSPVRKRCRAKHRFFFNYCTFGYTFPFWGWKEWERLIDWMALNGIDLPLGPDGERKRSGSGSGRVSASPKRRSGPSSPARPSFPGTAWPTWTAGAAPLPRSFIDGKEALQRKILARERALGMKPVLPAFAGHVPPGLRRIFPKAKIGLLALGWAGVTRDCATWFLGSQVPPLREDPDRLPEGAGEDLRDGPLLLGDPFNEIVPPSWDPDFLEIGLPGHLLRLGPGRFRGRLGSSWVGSS